MSKKQLTKSFWIKKAYFVSARKATLDGFSKNLGLQKLKEYSRRASEVLDCGCGDGTMIEMIWRPQASFWGVDISQKAVSHGQKRLKDKSNVHLQVGDLEKLEFPDERFDLVYTAYTLEHLDKPKRVIKEMIRVTRKNGYLILIGPNYGSPINPSPSSPPEGATLTSRAVKQFIKSHLYLFKKPNNLDWIKVEPLCLKKGRWQPDWDTVVEPYLQTLLFFLKKNGIRNIESKTHLVEGKEKEAVPPTLKMRLLRLAKKTVEFLEKLNIPPYKYFGPDFLVVGRKE